MNRTGKNLVVVRVDGGICSQINFFAYGHAIQEMLGGKAIVKYDLTWFKENGKDYFGKFVRNWDFPKAFPDLTAEEASDDEIAAAKRRRTRDFAELRSLEEISAPAYVGGYPKACFNLPGCRDFLSGNFRPVLDEASATVAEEIAKGPACAVHVRRGDLTVPSVAYGVPCSTEYFAKTIRIVRALEPKAKFFFFSDEPGYVHDELMPALPSDLDGKIVGFNGSDKGYMDLALIAKCGHVIASIGSLGVYGAFLGGGCLVVPKYSLGCFQAMDNVIYLNEDRSLIAQRQQKEERQNVIPGIAKVRCGSKRSLLLFNRIRIDYR